MPRQSPPGESPDGNRRQARAGRRAAPGTDGQRKRKDLVTRAPGRRLSAVDAAFIYLERKEIPLHIACLCIFDGPVPFDEMVSIIRSKLPLVPRYTQIVVTPPYNLGLPTWEEDPEFDVHRHIFLATVESPGGEAELEALASRILSQPLDRSKPLWDVHVIDGLKDGRGAMIYRVHHALADGIAGTRLLEVMMDPTPHGSRATRKRVLQPPRLPASDESESEGISSTVHDTLGSMIAIERGLVGFVQALLSEQTQNALKGLVGLLPELAVSVERLPFNKPCGGERKFCWAEFNFADVQAIRQAAGGTVNDVVLTVVTRALARYVKMHGQTVARRFVRIVCPVSLRQGHQNGDLGNLISFMPVALPMDVRNPVRMLRAVSKRTATMKHAGAAHMVALMAGCIAAAPPPLQQLFWWGLPQLMLPVPLFNMICTDVPGPPVPLYAAGRRLIATYPQVPTGYDLGINCAVQSYDGKLFFGLIADAHVASDVNRLRDFLYIAFKELCRAAGVGPGAPKKPRPKAASPRAKARPVAAVEPARAEASAPNEAPVDARPDAVGDPQPRRSEVEVAAAAPPASADAQPAPSAMTEAAPAETPAPLMMATAKDAA